MNSFVIDELAIRGFVQKASGIFTDGDMTVEFDSQFWRIGNSEGALLDEGSRTNIKRLLGYLDMVKNTQVS